MISKATIFFLFKSVICDFMVQGFSSIYDFAWVVQEKRGSLYYSRVHTYIALVAVGGRGFLKLGQKFRTQFPNFKLDFSTKTGHFCVHRSIFIHVGTALEMTTCGPAEGI